MKHSTALEPRKSSRLFLPSNLQLALLIVLIGILAYAPAASAHLVVTGFGPLADGLFHMFLGPDAILLSAAAGFLSAMRCAPEAAVARKPQSGRWLYLYGWVAFYAVALLTQYPFDYPVAAALTLLAFGLLVAADIRMPHWVVYAAFGWAGGLYGLLGGTSAQGMESMLIAAMFGVDLVLLLLVFSAARTFALRFPKARIALRVAGSWITAIGMLQLGWAIHLRSLQ